MEKTKMGMSVGLMAAGLYFLGFANIIAAVVAAIYVFVYEDSKWLKKAAIRSVGLALFFAGILAGFSALMQNGAEFVYNLLLFFGIRLELETFMRIVGMVGNWIYGLRAVMFLLLGFAALKKKDVSAGLVDKAIVKHYE
jgi:hypothetical protein